MQTNWKHSLLAVGKMILELNCGDPDADARRTNVEQN